MASSRPTRPLAQCLIVILSVSLPFLTSCKSSEETCSEPLEGSGELTLVRLDVGIDIAGSKFADGVATGFITLTPDESDGYSIPNYVTGDDCIEILSVDVKSYYDQNIVEHVSVRGPQIGDKLGHEGEGHYEYTHGGREPSSPDDCDQVSEHSGDGSDSLINVEYEDRGFAGLILAGYWRIELLERLEGGVCGTPSSWSKDSEFSDIDKVRLIVTYEALFGSDDIVPDSK